MPKYYTIQQAAERLSISRQGVYRAIEYKRLKSVDLGLPHAKHVIEATELARFIRERRKFS